MGISSTAGGLLRPTSGGLACCCAHGLLLGMALTRRFDARKSGSSFVPIHGHSSMKVSSHVERLRPLEPKATARSIHQTGTRGCGRFSNVPHWRHANEVPVCMSGQACAQVPTSAVAYECDSDVATWPAAGECSAEFHNRRISGRLMRIRRSLGPPVGFVPRSLALVDCCREM
jgi:hypothetical protein